MKKYYIFIFVLGLLCLSLIGIGFYVSGNPFEQQSRKLDQDRENDFSYIKTIFSREYARDGTVLPNSIDEFPTSLNDFYTKDPESGQDYEYKRISDNSYELCTTFSSDTTENPNRVNEPYLASRIDFTHKKGYDCVKFELDLVKRTNQFITPTSTLLNAGHGKVDLAITNVVVEKSEIKTNESTRVTAYIKNEGDTYSGDYELNFAVNGKFNRSATYIGLGAGAEQENFTTKITLTGGSNLNVGSNTVDIEIINDKDINKTNNKKTVTINYNP